MTGAKALHRDADLFQDAVHAAIIDEKEGSSGKVRFDGPYTYGDDFSEVKQVQDGQWFMVWPTQCAARGRKLRAP